MNELLEKLYTELRCYGPKDTFNKGFYLALTERLIKDMEADGNEYVKLPVYIGQQVWVPHAWYNPTKKEIISEIQEGKISMLQQKVDKSWKFRVSTRYVSDYTLEEINECIFFTEEAAEKALVEHIKILTEKYNLE